ncbi:GNAT family N-acetyltransferase [uncultured Alteromonas sp.]|jgi:tRNA(Met) cytidine acetyltransferase|uniref:GNAT family N-acetyltransferase n=1 Tax=uncultured Alteromonas sp. TaxID=179113 RepID=UPI00258EC955|nr:GNAT family N-acetyltransferase [uncultured Alteromonas sp.]|tara:strand:+ start:2080 stop:4470 length:2391 start_codon:yes stop_codon:yes gene_type:complete
MAPPELTQWLFNPFYSQARDTEHRRLLVLTGDYEWVNQRLTSLLSDIPPSLIVKEIGGETSLLRKHLLGNECDIGVVHSHQGFNPGNMMAIAGTIRWGGCLILCCPALASWHLHAKHTHLSHGFKATQSLYIKRLVAIIKSNADVAVWDGNHCHIPDLVGSDAPDSSNNVNPIEPEGSIYPRVSKNAQATQPLGDDETRRPQFKSLDQQLAFDCLTNRWSQDIRKAVITAPRGRGKSALVGLFVASRLNKGEKVAITSVIRDNTTTLFKHIRLGMGLLNSEDKDQAGQSSDCTANPPDSNDTEPNAAKSATKEIFSIEKGGSAQWLAPDNPTLINGDFDLLIIDEAASFPLPVLNLLIGAHDNYVITTTLQGYEGSGQGFMQRMLPAFETEGAVHLSLRTPLRWPKHDKLENLIHNICLFEGTESVNTVSDAPRQLLQEVSRQAPQEVPRDVPIDVPIEVPHKPSTNKCSNDYRMGLVSALSEHQLQSVMQLLATAHYQTTPDDFMRLCDSPDIILFTEWNASRLTAAAVINCEGGEVLADVQKGIADGSRRPKGHLGAQRLTLLTAHPETAAYRYWRINRIAVAPYLQGQGIGTGLIRFIKSQALSQDIDALTSSYGTSYKLNKFWQQCGFKLVDMGEKPNKASGETSALVVKAISERYRPQQEILSCLFAYSQKNESVLLSALPDIVRKTLMKKLQHFVNATRPLNQVGFAINALAAELSVSNKYISNAEKSTKMPTKMCKNETEAVTPQLLLLLGSSPLPTNQLIQLLNVSGRKALTDALRKKVRYLLSCVMT